MVFFDWIWLTVAVLIGYAIFYVVNTTRKQGELRRRLGALPDFEPTYELIGNQGETGIAVDTDRRKLCLISRPGGGGRLRTDIVSYRDLLSAEIDVDGNAVTRTSRGSQVGGALVGGLLFGTAGAVVGGLSGKRVTEDRVDRIDLKLLVNRADNPVHEVNVLHLETKRGSSEYKESMRVAEKWHGMLKVLIHQADEEDKVGGRGRLGEADRLGEENRLGEGNTGEGSVIPY